MKRQSEPRMSQRDLLFSNRVLPVKIDPSIEVSTTEAKIESQATQNRRAHRFSFSAVITIGELLPNPNRRFVLARATAGKRKQTTKRIPAAKTRVRRRSGRCMP